MRCGFSRPQIPLAAAPTSLHIEPLPPANMGLPGNAAALTGQKYHLKLYHLHTGECFDVVYRIGDTYLPAALGRSSTTSSATTRTDDESHYDPKEFDLLYNLLTRLGTGRTPSSTSSAATAPPRATNTSAPAAPTPASPRTRSTPWPRAIDIRHPGRRHSARFATPRSACTKRRRRLLSHQHNSSTLT